MPVIRAQDKISELQAGDVVEVFCTDPGAANDIPAWCRINGHVVLNILQDKNQLIIRIQVGSGED
jgi:tRNA 2-thiouridine synthesizing protein A